MNNIFFEFNEATLTEGSLTELLKVIHFLTINPDTKIHISGHTDDQGSDDYNMELSDKRAETVKSTMISMGITAERLESKGLGESMPITDNSSPEGKANNRRVEFVKL